jgi:DNA-binding PadR family transcriptional regulator
MTNAELAVLSLIAEQPRHGYEIEQVIGERGMREWTEIGFSSIYYLLKKLEREKLIEGQLQETERGPARKVFRLTEAGRDAYHAGLIHVLSVPQPRQAGLLLGLGNLPGVAPDEALAALRSYRHALNNQLDGVRSTWEAQQPVPYFVDALFDYGMTMITAELEWIDGFAKRLLERRADGNRTRNEHATGE